MIVVVVCDVTMNPNVNQESFPITSLEQIVQVLEKPPTWISRILPLHPRSTQVLQNVISDCHTELKSYSAGPRFDRAFTPKTLVCHDYKGGYLEDKHLARNPVGNAYSFYHWAHIDVFVYFSHHLITLPPLCWINAAHKNGVRILGTLITELDPGLKICEKFLKDEDTMRIFATSLTQLMQVFKFDGWLLNIENPMPDTGMLRKFVDYLTVVSHRANPHSLVIWYDSVIETGELKWQNELNPLNKFFFDHCDGIFLNYVWNEENIKNTVDFAKHRTLDVYVGIDVFGRNTFGGGQFDCYKAAQIIRRYNLSMAIFAPGWTHETLPEQVADRYGAFIDRDSAFWNSLWPYLYTHPIVECFKTSFFPGTDRRCLHIAAQQHQLSRVKHPKSIALVPDFAKIPTLDNKCNCMQTDYGKSEEAPVCLFITKQFLNVDLYYVHRLFVCDLELKGTITLYILTSNDSATLSLVLLTRNPNGTKSKVKLNGKPKGFCISDCGLLEVNPVNDGTIVDYMTSDQERLLLKENGKITGYQFELTPCILLEIGCVLEEGNAVHIYGFGLEQQVNIGGLDKKRRPNKYFK